MFWKKNKTNKQKLAVNKEVNFQQMIDILDKRVPNIPAGEYNDILLDMGFELLSIEEP